jgi:ring-1,2-phenylacetyl-CoA epoxidase subunit PaaE
MREGGDGVETPRLLELGQVLPYFQLVRVVSSPAQGEKQGVDFEYQGRLTDELIKRYCSDVPKNHYYLCGPLPLMKMAIDILGNLHVDSEHIHYEAFGPVNPSSEQLSQLSGKISFDLSEQEITVQGKSILDAALEAKVSIPSSCRSGNCHICAVRLIEGEVVYPNKPAHPPQEGMCLTCVGYAKGNLKIEA